MIDRFPGFSQRLFSFLILCFAILVATGCTSQRAVSKQVSFQPKKFLLRDEGLSQLSYVDLTKPQANWYQQVPAGRDMQLVGGGRVLIGTGSGYEEREITTGNKVFELNSFKGTLSARRLRNGNTLLVGVNWQNRKGIVLVEVDKNGQTQRLTVYPGFEYVRLVRETISGTYLITADDIIFEGDHQGFIRWRAKIVGRAKPHAWQAVRLANGQTLVASGFAANFQTFGKDGELVDSTSGPGTVNPHFFAGFQILKNGNRVVTNWQGHGPAFGNSGIQLLEYTPAGDLVWSWKQDAKKFSSLQGIIVLDDLDVNWLHVENEHGELTQVKTP